MPRTADCGMAEERDDMSLPTIIVCVLIGFTLAELVREPAASGRHSGRTVVLGGV